MNTYKSEGKHFLNVSGINISITSKEYTMLNNIINRTLKKYEYPIDRIVGKVESYCEADYNCCINCPYEAYCNDVTSNFYDKYSKEEYVKACMADHINYNFGDKTDIHQIFWVNTMEELIHYTEGET